MPAMPLADVVVLEPLPQHREVVDLLELADVEPPDALGDRRLLEVVDDLGLSGGRPPVQDHDIERLSPHAPPCAVALGHGRAAVCLYAPSARAISFPNSLDASGPFAVTTFPSTTTASWAVLAFPFSIS